MRHDAYRHPLVQRFGTVLRPPFQNIVGVTLHRADESGNAIVHVEAAFAAIRKAIEESSVVGSRGLVVLDGQGLEVSELLLRAVRKNRVERRRKENLPCTRWSPQSLTHIRGSSLIPTMHPGSISRKISLKVCRVLR